jgi:ribonuclease R
LDIKIKGEKMEEKEKLILDFMSDDSYIPMKAKEIASILCVPKTEYQLFSETMQKLENEYKIQKNRKSKYSLVDSNKYISGIFRANEKGFGFVKIEGREEEIYISKSNTKNALNGDTVLIQILDKTDGAKQEGKIIKVLTRDKDTVVGVFVNSKNYGFVIPDDRKLGTDIFISKKNFGKARNDSKVLVKITKYPENGKNAEGKIIEVLGNINEAGVDMLSLIKEYKLPYEFPEAVVEEAKKFKEEDIQKEIKGRLDLRNEEIFTIDGEDAKDLDDAVCVKKLENGNYELGVHIADVSNYVKEGSKLDKEAITRGTSIYMLDRVIPMLPRELSNGICSLNQKKDRLTLSVIMEIDKNGQVVSSQIKKSVINVTRRMSYNEISTILKYINKENTEELAKNAKEAKQKIDSLEKDIRLLQECKPYFNHFKNMEELAKILKARREKQGSLNLDIPETKIVLDEDGCAIDVKKYELSFANEIIEQFMLTANETVAETFYWLEAPFIYRVHEEPDEDKILELNKFLYNFGYKIKGSKDNIHPKAFADVLEDIKGKEEERVISTLILRTLKVARYESENKGHFGIASKYYCHFTSPIRRYPDLFIHRVISKYIDSDYNVNNETIEKFSEQATNYANQSSEREKVAQKVERDSIDIKKAEYMQDKIGEEYEGIVSSITSFGMFVELENTVEGLIRFEDLGDEYFIYDENKKTLLGEQTKTCYKIGDKVKIRVKNANKILRQIDFSIGDVS